MTNRKQAKRRISATKRDEQIPLPDGTRELELHAIEEQFLAEHRAGSDPQLATYLQRYPDYGAELATFVALTFIPDSQSGTLLLADDSAAPSYEHRAAFSSGTRRALEELFGADVGRTIRDQSRVAEQRASYAYETPPTAVAGDADDYEQ